MKKIKSYYLDKETKLIYKEAFPFLERLPIFLLNKLLKQKRLTLFKYYDDDKFIGIVVIAIYQNIYYVYFLAIKKEYRSHGYGSKILNDLKMDCGDKKLILLAEYSPVGDTSIKAKRMAFYAKNGLIDTKIKLKEASVLYSLLCFNGDVTFKDFEMVMFSSVGKFYAHRILNIREVK